VNPFPVLCRLVLSRLRWLIASGDERDAEILALRHQLLVLQRQVARPRFTPTDRTILAVLSTVRDRARLGEVFLIVKPATVIGWHRRLVARHWTYPPITRRGRTPVATEIRRLAIQMAKENPTGGTGASTVNSTASATRSLRQVSGRSSTTPGSTPPRTGADRAGPSSSGPKPTP